MVQLGTLGTNGYFKRLRGQIYINMGDLQYKSMVFDMYYEGRMLRCRVETKENFYGVHFDNDLMAVMERDENGFWSAQYGALDEQTTDYIHKRIESNIDWL